MRRSDSRARSAQRLLPSKIANLRRRDLRSRIVKATETASNTLSSFNSPCAHPAPRVPPAFCNTTPTGLSLHAIMNIGTVMGGIDLTARRLDAQSLEADRRKDGAAVSPVPDPNVGGSEGEATHQRYACVSSQSGSMCTAYVGALTQAGAHDLQAKATIVDARLGCSLPCSSPAGPWMPLQRPSWINGGGRGTC